MFKVTCFVIKKHAIFYYLNINFKKLPQIYIKKLLAGKLIFRWLIWYF